MSDGTPVEIYTLRNGQGMEARIMTFGGIVQSLKVADQTGKFDDVVLGYDNFENYLTNNSPHFGALIGRYGNRIGGARFPLNGKTYTLAANNGPNSLHGGVKGFDKVVWRAKSKTTTDGPALELAYFSKDGEEGFPGNLQVTAVYTLTESNELRLDFAATTDQPTVCNLTHHSYFNLRGQGNGDILGHEVFVNSDKSTAVDKELITTGEFAPVDGTPFDFRKPTAIGARINDPDQQLQYGPGYDHNWVIHSRRASSGRWRAFMSRRTVGSWKDGATSRACSFIPAIFSTAPSPAKAAGFIKAHRLLPGAAALSGFAKQTDVPHHGVEARHNLFEHNYLQVLCPIGHHTRRRSSVAHTDQKGRVIPPG